MHKTELKMLSPKARGIVDAQRLRDVLEVW
jgi:hypothetical protein